eukprot:7384057-Prymnesium_polylepis.1
MLRCVIAWIACSSVRVCADELVPAVTASATALGAQSPIAMMALTPSRLCIASAMAYEPNVSAVGIPVAGPSGRSVARAAPRSSASRTPGGHGSDMTNTRPGASGEKANPPTPSSASAACASACRLASVTTVTTPGASGLGKLAAAMGMPSLASTIANAISSRRESSRSRRPPWRKRTSRGGRPRERVRAQTTAYPAWSHSSRAGSICATLPRRPTSFSS